MLVDNRWETQLNFPDFGAGIITKKNLVDDDVEYEVEFTGLNKPSKWFERELRTNIGIGNFGYYPVKRLH